MKAIANNKKARFDYHVEEVYECGLVLTGTEIKSIRDGKVNINDAYAYIKNNEVFVMNMHVSAYTQGNRFNHDETRSRKLLLNKREIEKIMNKQKIGGYTLVCLKVYIVRGFAKLQIGLGKGKKNHDKRNSIKEKDANRRLQKSLKGSY